MILLVNLPWEEVAARCQRNHLAKMQFNYKRSGVGLLLFFLDNLKSLKIGAKSIDEKSLKL
jgi:hypothetical protein